MEIGNTQKTKKRFSEFKYGDGNTQTKHALIRLTLKKGFVMKICNTKTTQYLDKL